MKQLPAILDLEKVLAADEQTKGLLLPLIGSMLDDIVKFVTEDKEDQVGEAQARLFYNFYGSLFPIFEEKEMFEECGKIKVLVEYIEKKYPHLVG